MSTRGSPREADLSLPGLTAKLARILKRQRAIYDLQVRKNNMSEGDASAALDEIVQIDRLWRLWSDHAPELRACWPQIAAARRARREAESRAAPTPASTPSPTADEPQFIGQETNHPAVAAVLAAFPGAKVASVAPLSADAEAHVDEPQFIDHNEPNP